MPPLYRNAASAASADSFAYAEEDTGAASGGAGSGRGSLPRASPAASATPRPPPPSFHSLRPAAPAASAVAPVRRPSHADGGAAPPAPSPPPAPAPPPLNAAPAPPPPPAPAPPLRTAAPGGAPVRAAAAAPAPPPPGSSSPLDALHCRLLRRALQLRLSAPCSLSQLTGLGRLRGAGGWEAAGAAFCAAAEALPMVGLAHPVRELEAFLRGVASAQDNNSLLVVASAGGGKSAALHAAFAACLRGALVGAGASGGAPPFVLLHLDGAHLADDADALRELSSQLALDMSVESLTRAAGGAGEGGGGAAVREGAEGVGTPAGAPPTPAAGDESFEGGGGGGSGSLGDGESAAARGALLLPAKRPWEGVGGDAGGGVAKQHRLDGVGGAGDWEALLHGCGANVAAAAAFARALDPLRGADEEAALLREAFGVRAGDASSPPRGAGGGGEGVEEEEEEEEARGGGRGGAGEGTGGGALSTPAAAPAPGEDDGGGLGGGGGGGGGARMRSGRAVPYEQHLEFLVSTLRSLGRASSASRARGGAPCPVYIVIDGFDAFARRSKQTLLYSILDLTQSPDVHLAVVGTSTRTDALDLLEKRVKSRFSSRQLVLPPPPLPALAALLRAALRAPPGAAPPAFSAAWDAAVEAEVARPATAGALARGAAAGGGAGWVRHWAAAAVAACEGAAVLTPGALSAAVAGAGSLPPLLAPPDWFVLALSQLCTGGLLLLGGALHVNGRANTGGARREGGGAAAYGGADPVAVTFARAFKEVEWLTGPLGGSGSGGGSGGGGSSGGAPRTLDEAMAGGGGGASAAPRAPLPQYALAEGAALAYWERLLTDGVLVLAEGAGALPDGGGWVAGGEEAGRAAAAAAAAARARGGAPLHGALSAKAQAAARERGGGGGASRGPQRWAGGQLRALRPALRWLPVAFAAEPHQLRELLLGALQSRSVDQSAVRWANSPPPALV